MLADLALARRLERAEADAAARFVEARARVEPNLGAGWTEVAGAYLLFDGPDSPVTQSFGLGMFAEPTDADLDHIETYFFARGAHCDFEVSPLAGLAITQRLVQRGYLPIEQSNVLFQPLPRPQAEAGNPTIQVTTPDDLSDWSAVSQLGWSDFPEVADYVRGIAPVIAAREDGVPFLATLEGRPIAAAALCLGEGVGLLAGACTIPEARRQGAQRALVNARLAYAAEHGCDVASIVAEPGGGSQRNAQRQGFQVAYTRTKWRLSRPQSA